VDCFKPIYQSCSIFVAPQRVSYSFPNNGCLTLPCQVAWCSWQNSLFAPFTDRRIEYQIRWRAEKSRIPNTLMVTWEIYPSSSSKGTTKEILYLSISCQSSFPTICKTEKHLMQLSLSFFLLFFKSRQIIYCLYMPSVS
jgi:hypothetical protein